MEFRLGFVGRRKNELSSCQPAGIVILLEFEYLLPFFCPMTQQFLDLAQLVEHTTVTVKQSLYGRWFDSGSREMNIFRPQQRCLKYCIFTLRCGCR